MSFIGERRNLAENFTAKICWIALHYFHLHSTIAFNYYIIDLLLSYLCLMLRSSPNSNSILTINTRNTPSVAYVARYLQPFEKTHFLTPAGCLNDATLILRDSIFVKSLQRVILAPSALLTVSKYFLVKRRKSIKNRGKFHIF